MMLSPRASRLPIYALRHSSFYAGLTSEQFMKKPTNEPVLSYKKGSEERKALDKALNEYYNKTVDVPLCIGKDRITRQLEQKQVMPSEHEHVVARYTYATPEDIRNAIEVGLEARDKWDRVPLKKRADVFLHAADLCASKYRMALNATTMLGQGKNIVQAEIDSACELVDFLRFNSYFALNIEKYKPIDTETATNSLIYRALEGFVAAIAPFNFTAIGGNLASAPALMGNTVLWKPSDTAVLSNYLIYQILEEAGVPSGLIAYLPSDGPVFGDTITESPHFAALNFTGSVPTFKTLWQKTAENLDRYATFPRLIGECGGKNFHFIHPSADAESVVNGTVRAAFEYQGQKCSACSRLFVPESLWPKISSGIAEQAKQIKIGDVRDGSIFMSAVIDAKSFARNKSYIDFARSGADGAKIILGGEYDDSKGYFIQPTLIPFVFIKKCGNIWMRFCSKNGNTRSPDDFFAEVTDINSKLLKEEIFGPVVTAYVYEDGKEDSLITRIKNMTPYGLTGAVFAQDKKFIEKARDILRDAVGNLYLNDKSTGSVVGQQPFGGARASGTNDKAGGPHYVLRWTSPQTIKEGKAPLREWRYTSMD